ncbi:MAG: ParB/RepB/Spo0J family partition protein [Chloroflexi bacterium]|nr:ParB/RepB/Spo0J family partition protein [Chloroflexota bacterium]
MNSRRTPQRRLRVTRAISFRRNGALAPSGAGSRSSAPAQVSSGAASASSVPASKRYAPVEADHTALLVPVEDLVPGKNARSGWDQVDERLLQLVESIEEQGILEPILVRELRTKSTASRRMFEVLAGFRRWRAAQHLGLARVPVRVVAAADDESMAINLAENLARADLPEIDALRFVQQLSETYTWGVRKIARATGRSPSWISELLSVARSKEERAAVQTGQLGLDAAARIVRLREEFPEKRDELLRRLQSGERLQAHDVPRMKRLRPGAEPENAAESASEREAHPEENGNGLVSYSAAPSRGTGVEAGGAPRIAPSFTLPPRPPAPVVPGAVANVLELDAQERALVRNMYLVVRQVLSTLHGAWEEQGADHALPADVQDYLYRTGEEIANFLTRSRRP